MRIPLGSRGGLLEHLEETESKSEITLDLDGEIWEHKEAAI